MASLPDYLQQETQATVLARLLSRVPSDKDTTEGSFIWDALSPTALEFQQFATLLMAALDAAFIESAAGGFLDLQAGQYGLTRDPAVAAHASATFTGTDGTTIPKGSTIQTVATVATPAQTFTTDADATIAGGVAVVNVTAAVAGLLGNVGPNAITVVTPAIAGVTSVTNPLAATEGLDAETDDQLRSRLLFAVSHPSASGNQNDYARWAREVTGVGGAQIVPLEDGNGTVSVYCADTSGLPVTQVLLDQVEEHIANPYVESFDAETKTTLSGFGASVQSRADADNAQVVRFAYNASGAGLATHYLKYLAGSVNVMPTTSAGAANAGVWQARVKLSASVNTGGSNLCQIGVWNRTQGKYAQTTATGAYGSATPTDVAGGATRILKGTDFATDGQGHSVAAGVFQYFTFDFYWNGTDEIELRVYRLTDDTTATTVDFDTVIYKSSFSQDSGIALAPIGARVTAKSVVAVPVDVSVSLLYQANVDTAQVRAAATTAIQGYFTTLANASGDRSVRQHLIGKMLLGVVGVVDYTGLTLNGVAADVTINATQVATLGNLTLLTWNELDARGLTWNQVDALNTTFDQMNLG